MNPMEVRKYTVRFLCPAFLGNAEHSGEWRTPPFKALLRQWWRVAVAKDYQYDHVRIREAEGRLFGHAWLKSDQDDQRRALSRQSAVRIRLSHWEPGKLKSAPAIGKLESAPANGNMTAGDKGADAALYSGYGPVIKGPKLKSTAAIQAAETAELQLAFPAGHKIDEALLLMHRFGSVGGRSRNGWGSIELLECHEDAPLPLVDWKEAIKRDWPHGIGKDNRGALIWDTKPQPKWDDAMRQLAQLRLDVRKHSIDRHLLAFPGTKATVPGWKDTDRVPHSLRFKLCMKDSQFVGRIFHVPCRPSDELWNKLSPHKQKQLPQVFEQAHLFFDNDKRLLKPYR